MTDIRSSSTEPQANHLAAVAKRLPFTAAGALAVAAGILACLLVLINKPDWWRGFLAAGVVSVLATAISLVPLLWGLKRDLHKAAAGFLAATGLRMMISLGGCTLAVLVGGFSAVPTMLLMMGFYLTVLAAEVLLLSSAIWPVKDTGAVK